MTTEEFKSQYLPLSRRLYTVAWRITGNRQDAEDIVQECYIKLWNRRHSLSKVISAEAYAVTLVKRLCYDNYAERRNERSSEIKDYELPVTDNVIEHKDELNHVRKFIDQLSDEQKTVIRMREIEDRSFEEIAAETGLSAVNIRVLLSRARKHLRQQFKELLKNENR